MKRSTSTDMNDAAVYIVGVGACTTIGRGALASAAAVRAGINAFSNHPYMVDTIGLPMHVAMASWLEVDLSGVARFEELLLPALDEALAPLTTVGQSAAMPRVALALGLPDARPGLHPRLRDALVSGIANRHGRALSSLESFEDGHAAGGVALEAAFRKLSTGEMEACVVAGVDSYMDALTLEWLEASDQLHGAGRLNNAWGFVPGEAAGALLLMRGDCVARLRLPTLARLLSVSSAHESKRIKTETICLGEGLTQAFRSALQQVPAGMRISDVYCDMNGEPYRADEYGFSCLRTREFFDAASDFVAPADCWGDVGAAGNPLMMGLAVIAGAKHYAKGPLALVWGSSECGTRAAALINVQGGG
jgi:3-oxoacyl-[acyl-carrier-protein] synthase-1